MLDIVAVGEAVIAEEITVIPKFLNDSVEGHNSQVVDKRRRRGERLAQPVRAGKVSYKMRTPEG